MSEQKVLIDLVVRSTQLLIEQKAKTPFVLLQAASVNPNGDEKIILEFGSYDQSYFVQAGFGGELKVISEQDAHWRPPAKLLYRYY